MVEESKMRGDAQRKAELIAELERSRTELSRSVRATRSDLDLVAHLKASVVHQKTAWFAGAALTGWVLSRLPGRKKAAAKAAPCPQGGSEWVKEAERTGFWLAALNLLFNLFKPFLTAFASRKISELAARSDFGSIGHESKPFR